MALVPSSMGSCPSLGLHQWHGEGGTCCMGNSLSSISSLPRHQERGDLLHGQQLVFHITVAQTSGMWTGGTCCIGNSLASISPLPRHQGCRQGGPAAWATACLPYHPCTDIRDVERGTWCTGNSFSSISPLPRSAPWRGSSSAAAKRRHNMDYHSHIGLHSHNRCCSSTSTCWSWLIIHKPWPTDATVLDHNYYNHWGITALNTYILVNMTYWEINILSKFVLAL